MREPLEVLIVDPHAALRSSLGASLALESGIRVAGATDDLHTALRFLRETTISVALIDGRVADLRSATRLDGLATLARLVPVVVMGMGTPGLYRPVYLAAGASGYWPKYEEVGALAELLRGVARVERPAA
jgi:DNA-binding NarL/FixJ family response regulator